MQLNRESAIMEKCKLVVGHITAAASVTVI